MNRFIDFIRHSWPYLLAMTWMLVALWSYATEDYPRAAWFGFLALVMLICAALNALLDAHGRSYSLQVKQARLNERRAAERQKQLLAALERLDARP